MATQQSSTDDAACAGISAFQRDILAIIAREGTPYGLAVKRALEQLPRYDEINHGRLYPNIDTLVRQGFIEKGEIDRRTNSHALTANGRDELAAYHEWLGDCLNGEGPDNE